MHYTIARTRYHIGKSVVFPRSSLGRFVGFLGFHVGELCLLELCVGQLVLLMRLLQQLLWLRSSTSILSGARLNCGERRNVRSIPSHLVLLADCGRIY